MQKKQKDISSNDEKVEILRKWIFDFNTTKKDLFELNDIYQAEKFIIYLENAYELLLAVTQHVFKSIIWRDSENRGTNASNKLEMNKKTEALEELKQAIREKFSLTKLEESIRNLLGLKSDLEKAAIQASTKPYTLWKEEFEGNEILALGSLCNFFSEIQETGAPDNFIEGLKSFESLTKTTKEYVSEFLSFIETISEIEDVSRLLPYASKWIFTPQEMKKEMMDLKDIEKSHDYLEAIEYALEVLEDLMEGLLDKNELENNLEDELMDEEQFERELIDQIEENLSYEQQHEQRKKMKDILKDFQSRAVKASLGSHKQALELHNNNPYFMMVNMYNNSVEIEKNGNWKRLLGLLSTISSNNKYEEPLREYAAKMLSYFTEPDEQEEHSPILSISPIDLLEASQNSQKPLPKFDDGASALSKKIWVERSVICGVKIIGVKSVVSIVAWQLDNSDILEEELEDEDDEIESNGLMPELDDISMGAEEELEEAIDIFEIPWEYIHSEMLRKENKYGILNENNTQIIDYLSNKVVNKVFRFFNRLFKKGYGEIQLVMEEVISFDFGKFQDERKDNLSFSVRKKLGEMIQAKIEQWGLKHPAIRITLVDSSDLYDM